MSIFSSKTETIYTCYATRLYQDMPTVGRQTAISAIANNRNIAEDLVSNVSNGILFRANQFYRYASNGKYEWGLPTEELQYIPLWAKDNVKAVLQGIVGETIYIDSLEVTPDGKGDYVYNVMYSILTNGVASTESYEWVYNEKEGTYPTLTLNTVEGTSPYYPIIPIRVDNVNLAEDKDAEYYSTIRSACRMLDINISDLYDSINSQVDDAGDNPPEDMYILLATSISRNTKRSREYIFRFFEKMFAESAVKQEDYDYWYANHNQYDMSPPVNALTIQDSNYTGKLLWDYINREVVTGSIGDTGTYTVEYAPKEGRVNINNGQVLSTQGVNLRYQISATQYIEYFVSGLVYRNLVVNRGWVTIDLEDAFEDADGAEDGECFLIPLRKDICQEMGSLKSHDLMYDAIRLLTCDKYSYKVKWYQTGFFKIFVAVVAFIIAIWFPPAAGVTAWTAAAVGYALSYLIVGTLVMPLIMKAATDVFGDELALVLAVVATLYGLNVNVSGTASTLVSAAPVTVTSVFSALNTAVSGYMGIKSSDIAAEMEDIEDEADALEDLMQELYQEEFQSALDTAEAVNNISNDPYGIMGATDYVAMTRLYTREANYITEVTKSFVEIAKITDIPDSYIRLGI